MTWLVVGLGGAIGSVLRYGVNALVTRAVGSSVPWATALANIVGCGVIGLLAGSIASGRLQVSPTLRVFVFVGLLGGFTTFSSFSLDTVVLVQEGRTAAAVLNVVGQVGLGLFGAFAGFALAA
jgi:fluoride exporter